MPNLSYTFADALSELLPRFMPEIFSRKNEKGELLLRRARLRRHLVRLSAEAEQARGAAHAGGRHHELRRRSAARRATPRNCSDVTFDIDRYLVARGDARIKNWADWVANAKFRQDASRAGAENWVELRRTTRATARAIASRAATSRAWRCSKVMYENDIDVFVHPENTVPTPKIQGPNVGTHSLDGITPFFQIPRIVVPAGVTDVIYEPQYALNEDKTDYISVLPPGTQQSKLPHPMPISITFFAGQGEEPTLIKVGTAYESATHHRTPPPDFGPVGKGRAGKR